ncbi:hypothetical protein NA57DRAFT_54243 [Rhizodiscina lignyota]|uniref:Uncharacterized protein n=1 Tax=Rhizodiscina lignyota TaxID=1504668 RepID=A0A9P4MCD3_9PEZI|nr:hypothetical protein NA57DRAFT_54243 [Rhizodiscina lignyota]
MKTFIPQFTAIGAILFSLVEAVPVADAASLDMTPNPANALAKRSSNTGCVQMHCYTTQCDEVGGTDCMTVQVYHDGQYILHLQGEQAVATQDSVWKWSGVPDNQGHEWGVKIAGDCQHVDYLNTFQSSYGFYALSSTGGGVSSWDCGTGQAARKCAEWEATFADNAHCGGYTAIGTCDYQNTCSSPDPGSPFFASQSYFSTS